MVVYTPIGQRSGRMTTDIGSSSRWWTVSFEASASAMK